ncbi:MAG: AI-2E family transporter [Bacillota bacterium]|nr:AI-2E family transporter [Bacillota bacterium]
MKINFEEKHVKWGTTIFIVVLCSIFVFFAVYRFGALQKAAGIFVSILSPFIYGLVMAYLLCPVYNFTVRGTYALLNRGGRSFPKGLTIAKGLGTIVSLIFMLVIVTGIIWMIIPGLIDSIVKIIDILPSSMDTFREWIDFKLARFPEAVAMIDGWINNITDNIMQFVTERLLPEYSSIAITVSESILGFLNVIKNLFVAVIICAYFLNSKDTFAAQLKKIIIANCSEKTAEEIFSGAAFTNKTFGGFINGKLIDSAIIGVICFVVMSIFNWEYTLLISCIIGITNIIPFFGPFIGAVPSALLLLMVDPHQCVYFLIFILILQQFDGNILGPKILGDSTGLASFWVLFAVLVGGGMFGFIGMIIGIPVFAVIYAYLSRSINSKLERKGFSVELSDYRVDCYRVKKENRKGLWSGGKKNEQSDDNSEA